MHAATSHASPTLPLSAFPTVTLAPRFYRVAGIDPGARAGLVCLLVPAANDAPLSAARWIGSVQLRPESRTGFTDAENDARLFAKTRAQLLTWGVEHVALEEPWDNVPVRLQTQGTAFGIGKNYGLMLAAAHSVGARAMSYPVTSRDANPRKSSGRSVKGWTGWMPTWRKDNRGMLMVQDRTITLADLDTLSRALRMRPANGIMLAAQPRALPLLSEDERMALGVLRFHLTRQPINR